MITRIHGRMLEKHPTHVVVDCAGIGYEVHISLHTYSGLPDTETVTLFTHLQVREDAHTLFGFGTVLERSVFRLLLSVSGIGASTARTMLSSMTPEEIQRAILSEDLPAIKSIKGIGLKTAQRVLIELKDKVATLHGGDEILPSQSNRIKEEALSALEVLGYARKMSERVISNALQERPHSSLEELIKIALNKL